MRIPRIPRLSWSLVLPLLLAGCGGMGQEDPFEGGASGGEIAVEVQVDQLGPTSVEVSVVSETGVRRRLGLVRGEGSHRFTFDPTAESGDFRLVAEDVGDVVLASVPFQLTGETNWIRWDLDTNRLDTGTR